MKTGPHKRTGMIVAAWTFGGLALAAFLCAIWSSSVLEWALTGVVLVVPAVVFGGLVIEDEDKDNA